MRKQVVSEICSSLLVLLFAYTGVNKLIDHRRFAFQLHLVPVEHLRLISPFVSWLIPVMEILIVIGLLYAPLRKKALYLSVIMLLIFELYITAMLLSGLDLPCSCGGVVALLSWKQHLIFNAFFIAIGIFAIVAQPVDNNNNKELLRA